MPDNKPKELKRSAIDFNQLAPDEYQFETSVNEAEGNKTLMVQGTTSDAGKSMLVTALCRVLVDDGFRVAPFKPQNMALNSAVTECGGEIGRAQAVQAQAAKTPLQVHFNPILLKPQSDTCAQVIVQGKALSKMEAASYQDYKRTAINAVLASHQHLVQDFDFVVVEGAGSPAEINLRTGDIANMGFAERVDCPVILIADIDKGGVFAHLVGSLALLSQSEQQRVVGFVTNRFRGDIKLLEPGIKWLEKHTKKPVLGVLPYIHGLHLAAEDAVNVKQDKQSAKIKIIVPVTPSMSNHTDFDALRIHPDIDLEFVYASESHDISLPSADLIILAGSKNVIQDLAFIKERSWHRDIARHLRYGGKVFGICGGYQMLGEQINDPKAIESSQPQYATGLCYLPITTELMPRKTLANITGLLNLTSSAVEVSGYEIHAGISTYSDQQIKPIISKQDAVDGAVSQDQQVAGCYLHGIFDDGQAIQALTDWLGISVQASQDFQQIQEQAIELLAQQCRQHLDIKQILTLSKQWRIENDR